MQLEVGKYYKTRDGRKVGPMSPYEGLTKNLWVTNNGGVWNADGSSRYDQAHDSPPLIAEWTDTHAPTLSAETIDHIAIDSLKFHAATEVEPLRKEAFRIVLRYYGVTM